MLIALARGLVALFALALVAVTLLPLSRSVAWWVRMWDFPRAQAAAGLAVALPLVGLVLPDPWRWPLAAACLACLVYQVARILPYTPAFPREMGMAAPDPSRDVTLLAANVLMENTDHGRLRALIAEVDPDVLLLMETDAAWVEAVAPELARYATVLRAPRDDHYGMVFATRLDADARMVRLTEDETPAAFAVLTDADGARLRVVGLHPQPPVPGVDTEERDAQLFYAARFARAAEDPLVALGDFNDAAWSDTTRAFKRVGGYLDPRVGRGFFASFHADNPLLRAPIDQFFARGPVVVTDFRLGPHIGSDHFPLIARIRVDPDAAARLNRRLRPLDPDEDARIDAVVDRYRARLARLEQD